MNRVETTFNAPSSNALTEPLSFTPEVQPVGCAETFAQAAASFANFAQGRAVFGVMDSADRPVAWRGGRSSAQLLAELTA